jgi:hypothetical protein
MLTTEQLLNGPPPDLTLRFFATFARMEFALKQLRLLRFTAEGTWRRWASQGLSQGSEPDSFRPFKLRRWLRL